MAADAPTPRLRRIRRRAGTVRVRTTAAAALIVAAAAIAGSIALVVFLRESLEDDVRTAARLRAVDVAAVLAAGTPPAQLAVNDEEDLFIQVVDGDGQVVTASPNLTGAPPVIDLEPGESSRIDTIPFEDDDFLVVAEPAQTDEGELVVLVGRTLDSVEHAQDALIRLLVVGVPLLVVLVGFTTWRLVGRALEPVEAMRAEADAVSATELHRRVPIPSGDDEIARLATTLNRMLDRLEAAQVRQRRFVSDASHELRSPIATIRQHAEISLAHPDRIDSTELGEVVLEESLRVQRLVEDLLLLARADEHALQMHRRPVDLDDVVFDTATRLRATTSLTIDTTAVSAGRVSGDRTRLDRLLTNIVENAVRHARTTIAFSLHQADGALVLRVDDDGPGIPPDERTRVFERFVRLDDARSRDTGGSGLGLAIVAEIAAMHGGTATATTNPGGGARFEVRLPAMADDRFSVDSGAVVDDDGTIDAMEEPWS